MRGKDYRESERLPENSAALGIAIVGAGQVVNIGHLPGYRKAGWNVRGIYDVNPGAAAATAARFELPRVYRTLDELLDDPSVAIVDIAVPGFEQKPIALAAAAHGKHLLCQKPLAESLADATEIVTQARSQGIQIAVNLNMRWDPAFAAAKALIDRGFLGTPYLARFEISRGGDWSNAGWLGTRRRLIALYDTIHCFDALRFFFGDPVRVSASAIAFPTEQPPGERFIAATFEFASALRGLIVHDTLNWGGDGRWSFRFQGSEGIAKGMPGVYGGYPEPKPSRLATMSRQATQEWQTVALSGTWIPDGWIGTMAALQHAIILQKAPPHSGEDHLKTLQLVFAAYQSIDERRTVELATIR